MMRAHDNCVSSRHSFISILLGILTITGSLNAAALPKDSCDKQDTFFKAKHTYMYDYTIKTESEFGGVSKSKSGSLISCRVTFKVPRNCKVLMELSGCTLKERDKGASPGDIAVYKPVPNSQGFLDDLQRYELHFQVNKGVIVAESIMADDRETLHSLNIKRGLLSAIQFHILESQDYHNPVQEVDIFGNCPTNYTFSTRERNTVHTYKNLRQCHIRQIFKTQFTSPLSLIRTMHGGFLEGPISEGIYPFVSEVNCDYRLGNANRLNRVTCVQSQYFQPLAYQHGDQVLSAKATISQDLVLATPSDKLPKVDESTQGRSVIDIRFDFGSVDTEHVTKSELVATFQELMYAFNNGGYTYTDVPIKFDRLVQKFRHSSVEAMHAIMPAKDAEKENAFYQDALLSCGSEACLRCMVACLKMGHVDPMQEGLFIGSLVHIGDVQDDILKSIYEHLKKKGDFNTMLMLPLGTALSHKVHSEDAVISADSSTGQVIHDALEMYNTNCVAGSPVNTERQMNIAVKTIANMGAALIKRYTDSHYGQDPFIPKATQCLLSKNIPVSVKISYVKLMESWGTETQYTPIPAEIQSTFLTIVNDPTLDVTLRALTFKVLAETYDSDLIMKLIDTMKNQQDVFQFKSYILAYVRTLLENDDLGMKRIREAWETAVGKATDTLNLPVTYARQKTSTVINLSQYFKHMLADLWGGNLYVDLVYDPSFDLFSMLRVSLNYHHGDHKYNIAELSINMHGFDLLADVLTQKSSLSVGDLFNMYQQAMGQGQGQSQSENLFKFQQSIVNAVNEILDQVNHPGMFNFDFIVELKLQGKNVVFISIQEVMVLARALGASLPAGSSLMQMYLQKAMAGMDLINKFKNIELVGLEKVLPTCAGLPLNMTVNVGGFNYIHIDLTSNALMFMAQQSPNIEAISEQQIVFASEMTGRLEIPVGGSVHSSGIEMTLLAGSERGGKFKVKYGYDDVMVTTENPSKKRIQFSLQPILLSNSKDSERLLHFSGKMYLLHHSGSQILFNDPNVETTDWYCMPEDTQMTNIIGRSFCAKFMHANVTGSSQHAYFPLSGPFDLSVKMTQRDGVTWYDHVWEYFIEQQADGALVDNLRYSHRAEGSMMNRYFYWHLTNNRKTGDLIVDSEWPEMSLSYHGDWTSLKTANLYDFHYTDLITYLQEPYLGWGYRIYHKYDVGTMRLKFFYISPTLSGQWQLNITATKSDTEPDKAVADVEFMASYHCSQDYPMLYAFHLIPEYAMAHGDTSEVHFSMHKVTEGMQQTAHTTVKLYDKVITVDSTLAPVAPGQFKGHHDITYDFDGKQRTMTFSGLLTMVPTDHDLLMTTTMDMKGEGFTMHINQSFQHVYQQSITVDADIDFKNSEASSGRQKRSLSSIYEKFKKLEGVIVSEVNHLGAAMLGHDNPAEVMLPQQPVARPQPQFPQIPAIPSVWELPSWNSKVNFAVRIQPKFADGAIPGQSPPEAMDIVVDLTHKHPWNAGYRDNVVHAVFGRNLNALRFYVNSEATLTDTELDGSPRYTRDGSLDTFRYHGNMNIQQLQPGTLNYELDIKHTDGELHHVMDFVPNQERVFYFKAHEINHLVPFFTFAFEDTFSYDETSAMRNSLSFQHRMLNVTMGSHIRLGTWDLSNNGSISYQLLDNRGSFSFNQVVQPIPDAPPFVPPQVVLHITPASQPITIVFTLLMTGPHSSRVGYSVRTPNGNVVPLWAVDYLLSGSSLVFANVHWEPEFHDKAVQIFYNLPEQYSGFVDGVAAHVQSQIALPLMDKTLPFIPLSPNQAIQSVLGPYMFNSLVQWTMISQNLIPNTNRPAPGPGPNIAPRLALFYQLMAKKSGEISQAGFVVRVGETIHATALKLFSKGYRMWAHGFQHSPQVDAIIEGRNYSTAISMPFVNLRNFKMKTNTMHAVLALNSGGPVDVDAVVMENSDRTVTIKSFDGKFYNLNVSQSSECSYLLAADFRWRLASLVLSPSGLTLMTLGKSVTIGRNTVHLDNCKTQLQDNYGNSTLTVKLGERVIARTVFGLEVECDRSQKLLCYITHKGGRNSTIGLLGNHDLDIFSDARLLDGNVSLDDQAVLAEYSVGGPACCMSHQEPSCDLQTSDESRSCKDLAHSNCKMSLPLDESVDDSCKQETMSQLCLNEASKCGKDEDEDENNNFCRLAMATIGLCRRMNRLNTNVTLPDACRVSDPPSVLTSLHIGSLDVVFVVSQHNSMTVDGEPDTPAEFLSSLLSKEETGWDRFDHVRVGVIAFGGKNDEYQPRVVDLDDDMDNRYFMDRDSLDLDEMDDLKADGKEGSHGFSALELATEFPFSPLAHKMVILLMTKEQGKGDAPDLDRLKTRLNDRGIVLHVMSTYAKVASKRVIGIDWQGQTITLRKEHQEAKELPKNDYSTLIENTKGALWDLKALKKDRTRKIGRIIDEFVAQAEASNVLSCPAN